MPDLLDDLRRYGDAVEAAAVDRQQPGYLATSVHAPRRWLPRLAVAGAAAVALLILVTVSLTARDDGADDVRIDTPPTTVAPPTTRPAEPEATPATVLPASDARWTETSGPLTARGGASVVWTGSQLLIWGGDPVFEVGATREGLSDGASYDPIERRWTLLPEAPIEGRAYHVSAWTGSEMLVWGGGGDGFETEARSDGAAYDPQTGTWRVLPTSPLPLGPHYEGTWTGAELVVLGVDGTVVHGAAYDPSADSWRRLAPPPLPTPSASLRLEVATTGREVIAFSFGSATEPSYVLVHDIDDGSWTSTETPGTPWLIVDPVTVEDSLVSAVVMDRRGDAGPVTFDPRSGAWRDRLSIPDVGCVTGQQLAPWGRLIFMTACGRSGFYDPDQATWRPTTSASQGPAEQVVSTGDEILWVGFDDIDPDDDPVLTVWSLRP